MSPTDPNDLALPQTLQGGPSRNVFQTEPRCAEEVDVLRATSLNVLRMCPRQFAAKFLWGRTQAFSPSGHIGTIVHDVIESFLEHGWDIGSPFYTRIRARLKQQGMKSKEVDNLTVYLEKVKGYRGRIINQEIEFRFPTLPGYPDLAGHIDLLVDHSPGTIVIVDHKTSRYKRDIKDWQVDLQPIAYAWAIRKLFRSQRIGFRIGYVNHGYSVDWVTEPQLDGFLVNWFRNAWDDVKRYEAKGEFPAFPSMGCMFCPLKEECPEYRSGSELLLESSSMFFQSVEGEG